MAVCVDRVFGTTCRAKNQQAKQRSRQVDAERWMSLAHLSCEIDVFSPGSADGGRAGRAVPPSACQVPVRKVPGRRAFRFSPGL